MTWTWEEPASSSQVNLELELTPGLRIRPPQAQKEDGFRWWAQRLGRAFHMHNETRIDHFRGFAGYWAVPSSAETAIDGKWRKGPGKELFDALTEVRMLDSKELQAASLLTAFQGGTVASETLACAGFALSREQPNTPGDEPRSPHCRCKFCFTSLPAAQLQYTLVSPAVASHIAT